MTDETKDVIVSLKERMAARERGEQEVKLIPGAASEDDKPAKLYEIKLKSNNEVEQVYGYLALGPFTCILETPDDAFAIIFAAETGNVDFVRAVEVDDED